ncbi:MAG: MotA/TolQ/ExbB proton channel family protein [Silvanigrellales bacterium]|jgi:biopolymer transport protein TolQ|nr:MotA/TolQ/ExbB proton channel family protein [Silvanigrellales bacterium]
MTEETSFSWLSAITHGGPVGISVMLLLVILSLVTWGVIIERWFALTKLHTKSEQFLKNFWEAKSLSELHLRSKDLEYSPAREIFRTGYNEMVRVIQSRDKKGAQSSAVPFDTVKRSLGKARNMEEGHLAKNMSFLAVSASACPFIGLFGTVIGIIRAFHDIAASGSSSLAAVAPGISEALIATALGLFAAIPAVVFYNLLSSRARRHLVLLDGFGADFLNILERHFNVGKGDAHAQGEVI